MLLSFVAFIFILFVLQNSPWAQENVYEQLPPLFKSGGSKGNLSNNGELNSEKLHAHLEDSWQHAIPAPIPSALLVGGDKGGEDAKRPEATGSVAVDAQLAAGGAEAAAPVIVSVGNATPAKPTATGSNPPWVTDASRTEPIAPTMSRPANMKAYMEKMLKWARPSWDGHWPPFSDYINKKYDPNRWEQFPM
jgi:hypothetical protein